jgi:hypothetical protein
MATWSRVWRAVRKLWAAVWMELPVLVAGRRTAQCVFDLITTMDGWSTESSFHLGCSPGRRESVRGARCPTPTWWLS